MQSARNIPGLKDIVRKEAEALVGAWSEPDFIEKIMGYMMKSLSQKKAKL